MDKMEHKPFPAPDETHEFPHGPGSSATSRRLRSTGFGAGNYALSCPAVKTSKLAGITRQGESPGSPGGEGTSWPGR
jgi:hypothetical protein